MGRKPTKNLNLPAGMRARVRPYGTYYFLDLGKQGGKRKEVALGRDYVAAVRKWAELTTSDTPKAAQITFRHAAERYLKDVLPTKAPETQKGNLRELGKLYEFFDDGPLDEIEPVHVRQYLDWRVQSTVAAKVVENEQRKKDGKEPLPVAKDEGSVRANREKALFSHIWNFARGAGLTSKANPCAGIKGHAESGRDIYIDDLVYRAVWEAAETHLRDAMDLAYLTSQRPADVRKMTRSDLRDGAVAVKQNKTGTKLRVSVEGELAQVIERINARKVVAPTLAAKVDGTRLTKAMLRGAFDRARMAAIKVHPELEAEIRAFQFRDLRAKAATDKDEAEGGAAAQDLLGHTTPTMTRQYVRHRKGKLVKPTK
jgi:integrase